MQSRATCRQRRTVLRRIIAECDDVIEFPRQSLHALGPLRGDVDPAVAHSLERKRIDPGRMRPRTRHFDTGSCERPCQAFSHLASHRISGADKQDARGHQRPATSAAASSLPWVVISFQTRSKTSSAGLSKTTKKTFLS